MESISFTTKQNKIILQKDDIEAAIYIIHRTQKDYDFSNFKDYAINIKKNFSVQFNTENNSFKFSYHNPLVNMTTNTWHEPKFSSRSAADQIY